MFVKTHFMGWMCSMWVKMLIQLRLHKSNDSDVSYDICYFINQIDMKTGSYTRLFKESPLITAPLAMVSRGMSEKRMMAQSFLRMTCAPPSVPSVGPYEENIVSSCPEWLLLKERCFFTGSLGSLTDSWDSESNLTAKWSAMVQIELPFQWVMRHLAVSTDVKPQFL